MSEFEIIKETLGDFAKERDWDQFHSPKNLSMALIVEAAELVEHFQCLNQEQSAGLSQRKIDEISEELADILIYLVRIADKLDVDLFTAVLKKIEKNSKKYPVEQAKGNARKYSEL
jgi:NTP pyrophosphatase (non-canonical NTP hydrolase)